MFNGLKQDDIVLELGAYKGIGTLKLSHLIGNEGKIIPVEGFTENFKVLCNNIKDIKNIIPINAFVSNEDKYTILYSAGKQVNSICNELKRSWTNKTKIKVYKLDNLLKKNSIEKITYITLEINLEEYNALLGLKNTLINNNYIRIVCAGWYNKELQEKIIDYLLSLEFKVYLGVSHRIYAIKGEI